MKIPTITDLDFYKSEPGFTPLHMRLSFFRRIFLRTENLKSWEFAKRYFDASMEALSKFTKREPFPENAGSSCIRMLRQKPAGKVDVQL